METINKKKKNELFNIWIAIYQYQCRSFGLIVDDNYIDKVKNTISEYVDSKYPESNIQLRLF